jgi:hypothetical protein
MMLLPCTITRYIHTKGIRTQTELSSSVVDSKLFFPDPALGIIPDSDPDPACLTKVISSVADPGCLSRIPDPGFFPSRIPDPKKHGEVKKFFYFICFLTFL